MKVVGILGPTDAGRPTLVERLIDRLDARGRVGTITCTDSEPDVHTVSTDTADHRAAGAARTDILASEGWVAQGDERTLTDVLDTFAVACDYAVVEGSTQTEIPRIVIGGNDETEADTGDVLLSAPNRTDLDIDEVVAAVESVEPYETLPSLVDRIKGAPETELAGAIATFTGRVRARDGPDDEPTEYLEFERYDDLAEERLATIRDDLESREGVFRVLLHHKTGIVEAGEDIVFVVVLAGHRREAFRAVEDGIDRLKEEVPLFKKEVTVSDDFWRHEQ